MIPKPPDDVHIKKPEKVISENLSKMGGEVVCHCGQSYTHNIDSNMVEWEGFVVPICPKCHAVPSSQTRSMDL